MWRNPGSFPSPWTRATVSVRRFRCWGPWSEEVFDEVVHNGLLENQVDQVNLMRRFCTA